MDSVNKIGVIGAGQMGRGIAQVAAAVGCEVVLLDASMELAERGKASLAASLQRRVDRDKMTAADAEAIVARLHPSGDYASLADADVVVEAATENFDTKCKIFRAADAAMKDGAILASNTSSISLTKLAAETGRPDRVIGMHFMNPVPVMKLIEVIRAMQTSEDTYETVMSLGERMGKVLVTTKDMPGFIVNRLLIPFLNEACFALQEGLGTPEDIDTAIKLGLNHPMGPFELADLIGVDTVLYIAEVLFREIGEDKYRPAVLLRNYVAAGWLGRKSGRGFFEYDERGKRK